ncbi:MAG: alpha/beta hydrolase, partial [Candidatus Hydrogenedens sp.]
GNYIIQRGLDSYNIQNEPQNWATDLQQKDTFFLWFPRNVFTTKETWIKYHLGLLPYDDLLNKIVEEYTLLFNTETQPIRNLYLFKSHFYPSIYSENPLETICGISYEELAYGVLKELNIKDTLLDINHLLEVILLEYSKSIKNLVSVEESKDLFNRFYEQSSPDFEILLFKLITNLFPVRYSWKNFCNRFLSLLQKTIETQNSPIVEPLKLIHEKISTGENFPVWDKILAFFEEQGLCKNYPEGISIKSRYSFWKQPQIVLQSLSSSHNRTSNKETSIIRKLKWTPNFILSYKIARNFYQKDVVIFEKDFMRSFHREWSKDANMGRPFFHHVVGSRIGIVLSHGYLSAPMEIRALADYLYRQGYSVYGVRLKGHGTSPLDLAHSSYEDWYSALNRGIACVRARCEKVFLCGFSAGGCLVLSASANKQKHIEGVISISAPLKLQNYAINLVPTISTLNLVLKKFGGSGWELFDHHPENPHINYQKNPLAGLQQLRLLMEKTEELLPQITIPALIIQGSNDTTVNPDSANIIFHSISSEQKKLVLFNRARHGILNGSGSEEIFACVSQFIKDIAERKFETTKK